MQLAALAAADQDRDVILLSPTGSGKTLAFLLPLLNSFDLESKQVQALIIVPSRELAQQIEQVFKSLKTGLKITSCYGGHLRATEEKNLQEAPTLIVATPGRMCDHIRRGNVNLRDVSFLVLDEFDKSLELGFQEEVAFIIGEIPALKKRTLTSATQAIDIPEYIRLNAPQKIDFLPKEDDTSTRLEMKKVISSGKDKLETLFNLVCQLGNRSTIVFCNHRESVERTANYLLGKGIFNEFYHGAMEQRDRDSALCKFRNGSTNLLVTTDLASRGLDIPNIRYIIHYHMPLTEDVFTHRNGRTARVEASGTAILILSPEEKLPAYMSDEFAEIELLPNQSLPEHPQWSTLHLNLGRKDKVNKVDIVGFFSNRAGLRKEDIGLIEVKDFFSFVAIRKSKMQMTLEMIKGHKIKNKKVIVGES